MWELRLILTVMLRKVIVLFKTGSHKHRHTVNSLSGNIWFVEFWRLFKEVNNFLHLLLWKTALWTISSVTFFLRVKLISAKVQSTKVTNSNHRRSLCYISWTWCSSHLTSEQQTYRTFIVQSQNILRKWVGELLESNHHSVSSFYSKLIFQWP